MIERFEHVWTCLGDPVFDLHITTDGKEHSLRTTTLFFGVNTLQLQNYNIDIAKYVDQDLAYPGPVRDWNCLRSRGDSSSV